MELPPLTIGASQPVVSHAPKASRAKLLTVVRATSAPIASCKSFSIRDINLPRIKDGLLRSVGIRNLYTGSVRCPQHMEIRPIQFDEGSLKSYEALFAQCFPPSAKFGVHALRWLYTENPAGNAVGFDAWEGETLAAHYVCVPALISYEGLERRMLLSLNTATHPSFQGKGLFTKLAQTTYDAAARQGFHAVYGVANANSTPGFTRKLGFTLIQPLEARLGLGGLKVDVRNLPSVTQFQRIWPQDHLRWRCSNPVNRISTRIKHGTTEFFAAAKGSLLPVYAQLENQSIQDSELQAYQGLSPARLFLGLYPSSICKYEGYMSIPKRFRPSPLNFIFLPLGESSSALQRGTVKFSFLDFDAY